MTAQTPWTVAACDVDNTLLVDGRISKANHVAVQELILHGITVVITSGRNYHHLMHIHRDLGLAGSPVISSDGALVSIPGGRLVSEHAMPKPASLAIVKLAAEMQLTCLNFFRHGIHITSRGDWNAAMEGHRDMGRHYRYTTPEVMARHAVYKTLLYSADSAAIDKMEAAALALVGEQVSPIRNAANVLEFVATGVSKVSGLESLGTDMGFTAQQVLAFGDGINDVGMLSWAGLGICLAHGDPAAQAAARMVAPDGDPATNFAAAVEAALATSG